MAPGHDANNPLQAIANIFDNLEPKKQLGMLKASASSSLSKLKVVCKGRGIVFKDESHLQEFRTYLQYCEDEQISNHWMEIKCQEFLIKNKNNNNENKTKNEMSITTKEDIANNTDKLLDLLNEETGILKDDPIWKTISISAGLMEYYYFRFIVQNNQQKKHQHNH